MYVYINVCYMCIHNHKHCIFLISELEFKQLLWLVIFLNLYLNVYVEM